MAGDILWAAVKAAMTATVMLLVQSIAGISHAKEEDTHIEHLELAVRAFERLAEKVMASL